MGLNMDEFEAYVAAADTVRFNTIWKMQSYGMRDSGFSYQWMAIRSISI